MRHVLLVVACAVLLAGLHFSTSAVAQAPAARERWEYAVLGKSEGSWYFKTPATHKGEDDLSLLYKSMTGKPAPQGRATVHDVLSEIGLEGWELVLLDNGANKEYWFKRVK